MEKDKAGRWVVDELVYDPHHERGAVARDGDNWYLLLPGQEPREYKAKVSPGYMRLTFNNEYYIHNCVPRGGFRIAVGRAITSEEWDDLVRELALGEDDISNPFEATKGAIYGPEAMVTYTARQIRVPGTGSAAINMEQRLLALGIEATSGSAGRVDIRVEPIAAGASVLGAKGGAVKSAAKSEAAKDRIAERKAKGLPVGRPKKSTN